MLTNETMRSIEEFIELSQELSSIRDNARTDSTQRSELSVKDQLAAISSKGSNCNADSTQTITNQLESIKRINSIRKYTIECDCGFEFVPMKSYYSTKLGESYCECGSCSSKVLL